MTELPHQLLDWGELSPLKLRAQQLTDGLYTGTHRSRRRGSGIEFDGHRDYVPGDDLRRLDYRALMRHGRLLVRQFETDTDVNLCLLLDATSSMSYRSRQGRAAKFAYAALLAAALARVAIATGDLVSLDWLGGERALPLPLSGGRESFERLVVALEHCETGGDQRLDASGVGPAVQALDRRARRGSVTVLLSDFIDLPPLAEQQLAALSSRGRALVAVQVLDPFELTFPFDSAVRLKPSVGGAVIETDARPARAGYLKALAELQERWRSEFLRHGARFLVAGTDEAPADVVRRILQTIEGKAL